MKIIAKGWGTKSDIEKPEFQKLIKKLKIVPWSRIFEWPFVILNSDIKKGLRVLSAGCVGDPMAKYCIKKGCETHGIDIDNHNLPGLDFKKADIRNTPYKANYFDRIFCISVIEHIWDSPLNSIEELLRILKPGGRLALTTDINRGGGPFLFHQSNFDGLIGDMLGFKTGKIPEDVLKSEDSEVGIVCGHGLSVYGFVVEKE